MTEDSTYGSTDNFINLRILFFAKTRDLSGLNETTFKVENNLKVSELLNRICAKYNLESIKSSVILAINEQYCDNLEERLNLRESDEVAIIPPISGG